ncbi:MAG: EamA family transporter [Candidatus Dormibacteria bacterium]
MRAEVERRRGPIRGWIALVVVYLVWGSTFTGIQVAIRAIPPLLMAGTRYLLAGLLLYAIAGRGRRWRLPAWRELRSAGIVGLLLLLGGNGLLSWAELRVPSGLAALIIATVPLWMAVLGVAFWRQPSPGRLGWLGVLVGLTGVAVLANPGGGEPLNRLSIAALLLAALLWALGSLYSRRAPMPNDVFLASAVEMVIGGLGLVLAALVTGEQGAVRWGQILGPPAVAYVWLVLGGAILGYTCYVYALKVLPTATVATYAYVNPAVALGLGFLILGQGLSPTTAVAAALITLGVVLMVSGPRLARRRARLSEADGPGGLASEEHRTHGADPLEADSLVDSDRPQIEVVHEQRH